MSEQSSIDFDHLVKKKWMGILLEQANEDFCMLHYHNDQVIGVSNSGRGGLKRATDLIFHSESVLEEICFLLVRRFSFPNENDIKPFDIIILYVPECLPLHNYSHFGARFHVGAILEEINYFDFYFYEARKECDFDPESILKTIQEQFGSRSPKRKKRVGLSSTRGSINSKIVSSHYTRVIFESPLIKEGGGTFSFNTKKRYHMLSADLNIRYYDKKGGKLKGMYSISEYSFVGRGLPPNPKKKKNSLGAVLHQFKGGGSSSRISSKVKKKKKKNKKKHMSFAEKRQTVLDEHAYLTRERERILSCSFFIETKNRCFILNSETPELTNSWLEALEICNARREDFFIGEEDIKIDIGNNSDVLIFEEEEEGEGEAMIDLMNRSMKNIQKRHEKERPNTIKSLLHFSSGLMKVRLNLRRQKRKKKEIRAFLRLCGEVVDITDDEEDLQREQISRKSAILRDIKVQKELFPPIEDFQGKYRVLSALKRTFVKGCVGFEDLILLGSRSCEVVCSLLQDFQNDEREEELRTLIINNYEPVEVILDDEKESEEQEEEDNEYKSTRMEKKRKKTVKKIKRRRRRRKKKWNRGWDVMTIGKIWDSSLEKKRVFLDLLFFYAREFMNKVVFMDACYTNNDHILKILLEEEFKDLRIDANLKLSNEDYSDFNKKKEFVEEFDDQEGEEKENQKLDYCFGDSGLHRLGRAREEGPVEEGPYDKSTWSRSSCLTLLLSNGADAYLKNDRGETFIDMVKDIGDTQSVNIVESFLLMDDF